MTSPLRILVADDNEKIRNGICSVLETRLGWVVCGRAVDGRDVVQKAVELKPDVVLMDVAMPGLNGFEAAGCIYEQIPNTEILIVTEHDSSLLRHLSPQPGVRGYVVKSRLERDLIPAVEAAGKHQAISTSGVAGSCAPCTILKPV